MSTTQMMLVGLVFNFVGMLVGIGGLLAVILRFALRNEQRMTTLEVKQQAILDRLEVPGAFPPPGSGAAGTRRRANGRGDA